MNPGIRVLRRVGSWVAAAVALLLIINLGNRILEFQRDTRYFQRPFEVSVAMGETKLTRTFGVAVVSVRGAGAITDPTGGVPHGTNGIWIIVTLRATALDGPREIGHYSLRDARDRVFWASDRVKQGIHGGRTLQPGVWIEGEVAFEVPRDVATGKLTVLLAEHRFDTRVDSMIAVELDGVTTSAVDTWASDRTATLAATTVIE
ncbi:hypothetical protein [Luedemannella helvata]|uniref:DUF4352 domain-containing protein n=1 Tax=Luedemannella helvata TaxID=349315 RepID=A0ABP4VVK1_9ACTN